MTTAIHRTCLAAATLWVALHVTLGILYVDQVRDLRLFVLALGLFLLLSAAAVRPLLRPAVSESRNALVTLAVGAPAVELISLLALNDGGATSYANWAAGGTGLLLGALVFRSAGRLAFGSSICVIAIQTGIYAARPGPSEIDIPTAVLLAVPPQLWLAASWGLRWTLRHSEALALLLESRAAAANLAGATIEQAANERASRFAELEREVLPYLRAITNDSMPESDAARRQARELTAKLRDGLRARGLLDDSVRESLTAARARGIRVSLSSEPEAHRTAEGVRAALPALLQLPGLNSLTVRVLGEPGTSSVLASGSISQAEVANALSLAFDGTAAINIAKADDAVLASITLRKGQRSEPG